RALAERGGDGDGAAVACGACGGGCIACREAMAGRDGRAPRRGGRCNPLAGDPRGSCGPLDPFGACGLDEPAGFVEASPGLAGSIEESAAAGRSERLYSGTLRMMRATRASPASELKLARVRRVCERTCSA